jgi:glycosyltransferase involved in cell wall biosynthesis
MDGDRARLRLSICVATYNRGAPLRRLLEDLANQDLAQEHFEVIVVDDGSTPPASEFVGGFTGLEHLRLLTQANAGAATARHHAIERAAGDVVVIVDDDMRLPEDFLRRHLEAHERGAEVVQGLIRNAPAVASMPLFERFHAEQLEDTVDGYASGRYTFRGSHLCTGNVSFRRELYLSVGGFDTSLPRSEDRELGIRFEKSGAKLAFCAAAATTHMSDHESLDVWLDRGFRYGLCDALISRKHPDFLVANPWAFVWEVSPLSRPILMVVVALPSLAPALSRGAMHLASGLDRLGRQRVAVAATTLAYGIEYFRGVREDAGSLRGAIGQLTRYSRNRRMDP